MRISIAIFGAAVTANVLACAPTPPQEESGGIAQELPATYVYQCEGDYRFSVTFVPDSARIRRDEGSVTLPQAISASGARYTADGITFWGKGLDALLETPTGEWNECTGALAETPWAESRLRGYAFRALGQEPGWMVEVAPAQRVHVLADYGQTEFFTAAPQMSEGDAGATVYDATAADHQVSLTIRDTPCEDIMSGESFPATVEFTLDGTTHAGCGRPLDGTAERLLTSTLWTLVELDGQAVAVGARPPQLSFDDSAHRVTGFTGCNRLTGGFTLEGDQLRFAEALATTRMACMEPEVAALEQRFLAILSRIDRFSTSDGSLTLLEGETPLARLTRP